MLNQVSVFTKSRATTKHLYSYICFKSSRSREKFLELASLHDKSNDALTYFSFKLLKKPATEEVHVTPLISFADGAKIVGPTFSFFVGFLFHNLQQLALQEIVL